MAEAAALAGAGWAVSMTGWVASPIISKLLNEGFSCFNIDAAATIDKLEATILPQFQEVINAAQRSEHRTNMDNWLRRLKAAMYEAEDAIDLHKYRLLQQQVENGESTMKKVSDELSSSLGFPTTQKIELKECLEKLEKIALEAKEFRDLLGKHPKGNPGNSIKEPMVTTSKHPFRIFGRDADCDYLIQELLEPAASEPESSTVMSYSVHSIVGVGGAGKTTLAQLVYNDKRVTTKFDLRIWLSMTRGLDLHRHTRMMVEAASKGECPRLDNFDVLQDFLIDSIKSKKVLIVMDDVWWDETMNEFQWEQLQWEQFLAPLVNVERGSKILLTSRTKKMPHVLLPQKSTPLKELEENQFLSLFMHHAFGGVKINGSYLLERLERIGKQIAKKLSKSPLAAKTVGSCLCKNRNERFWRETLDSDMLSDTSQSLLWSYQNLDAPIQRCFSYCSIFPKGYGFEMEDMVTLWVAEGFIQDSGTRRLEDVGRDYFQELFSVFFFQNKPLYDPEECCVMHDLVHDLAERVSKDDCFRIEDGQVGEIPLITRHLSVQGESLNEYRLQIEKLKSLRTLIFINPVRDEIIKSFLKGVGKLTKLRVLKFCYCFIKELPDNIGELVHLRYLDLKITLVAVLPTSLQKLYSLQTLNLPYRVNNLPENLNRLISLRHLVTDNQTLMSSLSGIGKLTSLQELHCFTVKKEKGYEIGQLMLLNEIGGPIRIDGLQNVEGKEKAAEAKLKDKKYVESLSLIWGDDDALNRSNSHSEVLEGLKPHQNLKALAIVGYKSSIYPSWILQVRNLENLASLKLSNCPFLEELPPISTLFPYLHELTIDSLPKPTHLPEFPPSLKSLEVSECWSILFTKENLQKDEYKMRFLMAVRNSQFEDLLETIPEMNDHVRRNLLKECSELQKLMEWDSYSRVEDIGMLVNDLERTQIPAGEVGIWEAFRRLVELRIEYLWSKKENCLLVMPSSLETLRIGSCYITDEAMLRCLVQLTCLKSLFLKGIQTITALPPDEVLRQMVALTELGIENCECLISIVGVYALPAIKSIDIRFCPFLEIPGEEEGRRTLPPSLESIYIKGCHAIKHFQFRDMPSLSKATFQTCAQLRSIVLTNVPSLENLEIIRCSEFFELIFSDMPETLRSLKLDSCPAIRALPDLPKSLLTLCIAGCQEILSLPDMPETLEYVQIDSCPAIRALPELPETLRSLYLNSCPAIRALPELPETLGFLSLISCPAIRALPELPETLRSLRLNSCPAIRALPELPETLKDLDLDSCPALPELPETLGSLKLSSCPAIRALPELPETLGFLNLISCPAIRALPELPETLRSLGLSSCPTIRALPELPETLKVLQLYSCPAIRALPDLPKSLEILSIRRCPGLERRCQEPDGEDWPKICHVPRRYIRED